VKGDFFEQKWDYNAWMQYGKNVLNSNYQNDFSSARIARATNVVADPNTGQPVCASALDGSDPNCVPYNIFQIGGVTPAALAYLQTPGLQSGYTSQTVYGVNLTSDLGTAYGWRHPGQERRRRRVRPRVPPGRTRPEDRHRVLVRDLAGQGGPTIGWPAIRPCGSPTSRSGCRRREHGVGAVAELHRQLPVFRLQQQRRQRLQHQHLRPRFRLGADPRRQAARQLPAGGPGAEHHRPVHGAGHQPVRHDADPCGPSKTATAEQCARTGLAANLYGADILDSPAGQYNYLQGGNAQLQPETAKTWTLGLVLQPMANLAATIDYWSIKVDDVIDNIQPVLKLQQCLDSGTYCNDVQRDAFGTCGCPDSAARSRRCSRTLAA